MFIASPLQEGGQGWFIKAVIANGRWLPVTKGSHWRFEPMTSGWRRPQAVTRHPIQIAAIRTRRYALSLRVIWIGSPHCADRRCFPYFFILALSNGP